MSLWVKGLKTIQRTYTPNSRVTIVPNRSRMKPLARDRKLLRKEAMVNTRENCESCWLQPERKTDKRDRGFLRYCDFLLGCFIYHQIKPSFFCRICIVFSVTIGTGPLSDWIVFLFCFVFLSVWHYRCFRPELTCPVEGAVAIRDTCTQLTEIAILLQHKHQSGETKDHT